MGYSLCAIAFQSENLTAQDVVVTCIAEFTSRKNHALLLDAWQKVTREEPRAHLLLIGDGQLRKAMEHKVKDVGDAAMIVGETGWVVPPRDPNALADAIQAAWAEWSSQKDRWSLRQQAARQRVAERFSIERMTEAYRTIWEDYQAE